MVKRFMVTLFLVLSSLATAAQENSDPMDKPDASGDLKTIKAGKLPRQSAIPYLEARLKHLVDKIDPNVSGRKALPHRIIRARKMLARFDKVHGGLEFQLMESPLGPKIKNLFPPIWPILDYSVYAKELMDKWIPKYKTYLEQKFGTETSLSRKQLEHQVWNWLVPREKAELNAEIQKLEKEFAHTLKSIHETRDKLAKKKEELKTQKDDVVAKDGAANQGTSVIDKSAAIYPTETAKRNNYAVDDVLNRTEIITKDPRKPEEGRIIDAGGTGMLVDNGVRLSHLGGCGAAFTNFDVSEETGFASTPCSGLIGGRVASQADFYAHCNTFEDFDGYCGPPGPGTERNLRNSGVYGMPLSVFCLALHYGILSKSSAYNEVSKMGDLVAVHKYDNGSRRLACFYLSKDQAKALHAEFKSIKDAPADTKPEESKDPPASVSSNDDDNGVTTTSVQNPDGTRTVTKTDKQGNVLSKKIVGKSPASASSTDNNTGITTTSIRNPDDTRTVTTTDKQGNVLSVEKVQ